MKKSKIANRSSTITNYMVEEDQKAKRSDSGRARLRLAATISM